MDAPRPVRETNPEVPDWLAEIIEKLHAKQPRDRFQSAEEVSDLLARHLAHLQQPTVAPRPARLSPHRFTLSRWKRSALCVGGAVLLVSLATVADWRWSAANRGPRNDAAAERADDAPISPTAVPGEAGDLGPQAGPDVRPAGWPEELAETEMEIQRLESQLRYPASTLPSKEREGQMAIESALQTLERELDGSP
jgi:serine/threonine protein kinase